MHVQLLRAPLMHDVRLHNAQPYIAARDEPSDYSDPWTCARTASIAIRPTSGRGLHMRLFEACPLGLAFKGECKGNNSNVRRLRHCKKRVGWERERPGLWGGLTER